MSELQQVLLRKTASRPHVIIGKRVQQLREDPVAHGMSTKLQIISICLFIKGAIRDPLAMKKVQLG